MKKEKRKILDKKFDTYVADNFFLRLRGLLFRQELNDYECMLLTRCNSVHTICMRYPIDVIFLDENYFVTKVCKRVYGLKLASCPNATHAIEFKHGVLKLDEINIGSSFFE